MHSHHKNTIDTVEDWLSLEEEEDNLDGADLDHILKVYTSIHPVQGTALLYTDESICQEEK